jgi:hypothetical protein
MSDRPTKHEVKAGQQHVPRIAKEHGFESIQPIWEADDNAELRRRRVNPNTLAVGDIVVVPADDPKTEPRPTQQVNVFTVVADPTMLAVRLLDEADRPFADRPFVFNQAIPAEKGPSGRVEPRRTITAVTDAKGLVEVRLDRRSIEGELTLPAVPEDPIKRIAAKPEVRLRLIIGALDPANTIDGVRARLNNLGYFAGFTANDVEQLAWAYEEFQADQGIKRPTPLEDRKTFTTVANLIAHVHGDLLASETVPES